MKKTFCSHWSVLVALALCLVLSAGCSKASEARRVLESANSDFQKKKYDEAEKEYRSVLRLSLRNPVAIRQLGLIYFEEGRSALAFRFLQESLKQDPKNTEVQVRMAELYGTGGDSKKAEELLGSVLNADPGNERALALLVETCPTNEIASVGERLKTQILEGGQGEAACHSALGWIYLRMQKLSDAEIEFNKGSALDPKLASPYIGWAALYSLRKDATGLEKSIKAAAERSPVRSSIRLRYVEFKVQTGAGEEAKEMLRDITRQAPDYIPAWLSLMKIAFAEHKYDECKTNIDTILARDSLNFDAMMESGTLALTQRDGPRALAVLLQLNEVYKTVPQAKYDLAKAYLLNNDKQKAVANLKEALSLNRDYEPATLLLAQLDFGSGNFNESETLLSKSIKNHPEDAQAQMTLAETYLAQDQPKRALEVYQKLAQMYPKNPEILRTMGVVYYKLGDSAKARAAFEKSLEQAPDYMPSLQQINSLDISEKRYAEAHRRIDRIIEQNPKVASPLILQGDIYRNEGQTNLAESAYAKAIEINPELSAAYLSLAEIYLHSNQEQRALDRLVALAAKHTNDITALMMIGGIEQTAGRYDKAADAYKKVLAVDSNSFVALNNLAYVDSEHLSKVDEALQLATRARALRPDDPRAADTLGWILFKKREYAQARSAIQESADKQPGDPEVQMHLGMAHYMLGEEKPAHLWLQQAVASHADFPGKDAARRHLEVLDIDPTTATPEVVQKLQAMVQEDPLDPVPWSHLAAIEEQRGDARKAADSLQKLLLINPKDASAMIRLSRLYADQLKEPHKAFDLAKSAHSLAPDDGRASALLGELAYLSNDYPWAMHLLEDAAHRVSDQPSLFYHLALAYYAMGKTTDADEAMQKAVQQGDSPSNLVQAKQFQAMRAAVKDPAKAQASSAQVEQILAKDPNYVPALMVSALQAERKPARDEAVQTYKKVLTIYPLFVPATRQLAILYSQSQNQGDLDKAYDMAEKARASLPNDLELAKTVGLLAYGRKDYNRSMLYLKEYAEKSGGDGDAFYYLGMDYYNLKQTNLCKQALTNALALHSSESLKGHAEGILKDLNKKLQ
jgi:tetratricopeptide (TPR) repeat protein